MSPLLNAISSLMRLLLSVLDQRPVDDGEAGRQWRGRRHGDCRHPGAGEHVQVRGGYTRRFPLTLSLLFRLYGYKWFSSATDSDMSMSLARVGGGDKLSMFYLKTRDEAGRLNNIQVTLVISDNNFLSRFIWLNFKVVKMKNKLGTRQLPTAELLLDGTEARLVAEEGRGIASISSMLTITRLHNTLSAVSAMR